MLIVNMARKNTKEIRENFRNNPRKTCTDKTYVVFLNSNRINP